LLPKARILLKADVSDAGEGWSDSSIYEALDTSSTISAASAIASSRTARGGAEAQTQSELRPATDFRRGGGGEIDRLDLLASARGFARWSLRLLEKVGE
jgi:hypothetical protein